MTNRRTTILGLGFVVCLVVIGGPLVGCGPSSEELKFQASIAKTKREFRASAVSAAALPLYAKYNLYSGNEIPTTEIPNIISSLPIFQGASPEYIRAFAVETNELMFMTGSGFGHWGIITTKYPTSNNVAASYVNKVTPWDNGIFFYRE